MVHEILAKLGINTSQFEAGLNKAKGETKAFAKEVKDRAKEAKDAIADIAKDTGGGKLTAMIGFAGAGVAATAFGAAVVDAIKDGIGAFGQFETSALRLGTVF